MKHYKRFSAVVAAILLFTSVKFDSLAVIQYDYEPRTKLPQGADLNDYIALTADGTEYVVQAGDTLWGISQMFFGTGTRHEEVFRENQDIISDENYIFPGQVLGLSNRIYIPKDQYDRGGLVSEGAIHIASPDMVDHNMFLSEDIEDHTSFNSGITIYSLPVTNHMGENALTNNWDDFTSEVLRCSQTCGGRVSNLAFERYEVENGCDLCGYYFDFDTGEKVIEFVAFFRLGKQNMVEVIGLREKKENTRLLDVTRYIAASFEDFGGRVGMGYEKRRDNIGAWDWNYPELHNLFTAAMTNFIDYTERPQKNMPGDYEIVWKEPAFEQAVRSILTELWELDEEEEKELADRPLMASDISVISKVQCTFYTEGSPYADEDSIDSLKPVVSLVCNGQKEEFAIPKDGTFSYQDLGNFKGAEQLGIYVNDLAEYSFLADMPQLRSLTIVAEEEMEDVSFLSELSKLRSLSLLGAYYGDGTGNLIGFEGVTDLSVLEKCPELRYLYLQTPRLADFSFLKKCPEICTIKLLGDGNLQDSEEGTPARPDLDLLPNARFIEFYGESLRFEP